MTIDEAKKFIEGQARQNQVGNITPAQMNIYFERAQLETINDLAGNIEEYQPGRPVPRKAFEMTSIVSDNLSPIIASSTIGSLASGVVDKPADYLYLIPPLESNYVDGSYQSWIPVVFVTHGEKALRLNSQINYPESDTPVGVNYGTFFQVYPTDVDQIRMTYLRRPLTPKWAYTTVNSYPVYDSANSQNFELPESVHMKICQKVLEYIGVSLRDPELLSVTENKLTKGT